MAQDSFDEELNKLVSKHTDTSDVKSSNDSKESKFKNKNTESDIYEENNNDPLTDKTMDDREW